jgi:hypothetical protein
MPRINHITPTATALNFGNCEILISYQTPVAITVYHDTSFEVGGKLGTVELKGGDYRTEKKWSVTTSGHINRWANYRVTNTVPQLVLDAIWDSVTAPST